MKNTEIEQLSVLLEKCEVLDLNKVEGGVIVKVKNVEDKTMFLNNFDEVYTFKGADDAKRTTTIMVNNNGSIGNLHLSQIKDFSQMEKITPRVRRNFNTIKGLYLRKEEKTLRIQKEFYKNNDMGSCKFEIKLLSNKGEELFEGRADMYYQENTFILDVELEEELEKAGIDSFDVVLALEAGANIVTI